MLVPAVSPCLDGASWHGHDLPFGPTDEGLTYLFTFFSEVGMELSWRRKKQQIHLGFWEWSSDPAHSEWLENKK